MNDDHHDNHHGLDSSGRTPTKSASSSSLSSHNNPIRRRSSFARVFSTLGLSPGPTIAEDNATSGGRGESNTAAAGGGADDHHYGPGVGGGNKVPLYDESGEETNPNTLLLPPRFRRGSSAEVAHGRRLSVESIGMRDRTASGATNSGANNAIHKIPRWALHDQSAIVMKDSTPISMGTLLHHHTLLNQPPTSTGGGSPPHYVVTPTWRLKERMKTVGVCLVLALNVGTDPPDLNKPSPCAKLQCWLDPTSISRAKAKERIGERLEQQYANWQQRSKPKYRRALDPTVDMVKELCLNMRKSAKQERVLLHYNGHGVPRPTANGEIWLFDKHHTNYIPLSITDLRRWIGKPSIVVLDCSGAGVLMPFFTAPLPVDGNTPPSAGGTPAYVRTSSTTMDNSDPGDSYGAEYLKAIRDTIVLCPTAQGEWLPLNPDFPADIFTSCLTTPISIALRWFVHQTPLSTKGLDLDTIADAIPGKITDRKTPLGELNWIFTAITDTIAWNVLPSPLFQRLFRQDLLVASMFRNFLLADRILRSMNCSPISHPELPSTCHHPLWQAWDLVVETCLTQLIDSGYLKKGSVGSGLSVPKVDEEGAAADTATQQPPTQQVPAAANPSPIPSEVSAPFFAEQLTSFEIWLEWASVKPRNKLIIRCPPSSGTPLPFLQGREDADKASHELDPPQELPIVLQVLLSQAHRVRALVLLKKFLDLGPSAVNLALSVGIFPYVLKLLQSPIDEYKHVLIGIWAKVVGFDPSCQEDVVKDRALLHFIRHLNWGLDKPTSSSLQDASEQRTMAAFILSVICFEYQMGQSECITENLHKVCNSLLLLLESPDDKEQKEAEQSLTPQFRMWLLICIGNLAKDNAAAQYELFTAGLHFRMLARLDDDDPHVRMGSCYALGYIIGSAPVKKSAEAPALPTMLNQQLKSQLKPKLQQAPQALAPTTFQQGSRLMPGTMPGGIGTSQIGMNIGLNKPGQTFAPTGMMGGSTLMPTLNTGMALLGQLQPQQTGGASIIPGSQPMMFSNLLRAPSASPQPPETKSVYEDGKRLNLDLSVATELAAVTEDASPVVRFEAILALNRFIGKYVEAFVSMAGKNSGGQLQARSVLGGSMLSIPMPEGLSEEAGEQIAEIWTALVKCRSDPFSSIRELVNSIVIVINKRAMARKNRQLRTGTRRRSLAGSIDERNEDDGSSDPPPSLAGRRTATGLSLSSYGSHQNSSPTRRMNRAASAGGNAFMIGTPPLALGGTSPRKEGQNQSWAIIHNETAPVEEYFYPESKLFAWQRVAFGEQAEEQNKKEILDPLSEKGAMKRYRKTRNNIMQQKSHLLKESFAVLAERPRFARSPYGYEESDAAAGLEKEVDLKKEALQMKQTSLLRNSGGRSTSLLRFHPYEPVLAVFGSTDVSIWNAESSERISSFSNNNPKSTTRITSALWLNEASNSLLLTGCSDGTVRVFDVSLFFSFDDFLFSLVTRQC